MATKRQPATVKVKSFPPLGDPEKELLSAVKEYIRENRIPPSQEDLAGMCGVSKRSAQKRLAALVNHGLIRRQGGKARSLVVTKRGETTVEQTT